MSEELRSTRIRTATVLIGLLLRRRQETVEMLASCKVNARDIPRDVDLRRDGNTVLLRRFVRDFHTGNIRHHHGEALTEKFSVEPDVIPDWIPSI